MISQKPYLIRAIYEWCTDNEFTPYLMTFVDDKAIVPQQYVHNNQIVFNIAYTATKDLLMDNEWITFKATFSGEIKEIVVPMSNILALFAKENGLGMQFELETSVNPAKKTDLSPLKLVK